MAEILRFSPQEWYHGPCIGVSESKAGKFEKFACIRCAMKDVFDSSASAAVGLIRKVGTTVNNIALSFSPLNGHCSLVFNSGHAQMI